MHVQVYLTMATHALDRVVIDSSRHVGPTLVAAMYGLR